jgi:hypothetical protein
VALDDRYANKFAPHDSTVMYPKPGHKLLYTPMTSEMKCPIGYTFALRIVFHLLWYWCNTYTNLINKWYDPLHIITWPYWFIDFDLTCFSPLPRSIGAKSTTCPSLLQPVYQAKSCFDLLHFSHLIPCHVSYAMSSFITCMSFATYPSHFTSMAWVAHTSVPVD